MARALRSSAAAEAVRSFVKLRGGAALSSSPHYRNPNTNPRHNYSTEATVAAVEVGMGLRRMPSGGSAADAGPGRGLDLLGVREYEEYRRSLYGEITHKAVLVDAVGTLLVPSQPMAQIYRQIGEKYGVDYSEAEILNRYRWAYGQPWGRSRLSFCF